MASESNSGTGGIPRSMSSYLLMADLEEDFTLGYKNEISYEVIEAIVEKVNILFNIWKKLGSKSAVRYVANLKDEHISTGMLRLLDDNRVLWTFDMFHDLLPEINRLSQHHYDEYLELTAKTVSFLIISFKPVIINNLISPKMGSDSGRIRRHCQCKTAFKTLIEIKRHFSCHRYKYFPLHEEVIALIQDLEDSTHR